MKKKETWSTPTLTSAPVNEKTQGFQTFVGSDGGSGINQYSS